MQQTEMKNKCIPHSEKFVCAVSKDGCRYSSSISIGGLGLPAKQTGWPKNLVTEFCNTYKRGADKEKKKFSLSLSQYSFWQMTDPRQYAPDDAANDDGTGLGSPLIPLDLDVDYSLTYPSFSESNSAFTADTTSSNPEEPEDMQEVLDALLDLHSLQNMDPVRFEKDYVTILKAINLNDELQSKVQEQIRLVEEQLDTNSKLLVSKPSTRDNSAHTHSDTDYLTERGKSVYTGRKQMWRQISDPHIVSWSNQLFRQWWIAQASSAAKIRCNSRRRYGRRSLVTAGWRRRLS